jgi:cytoskeletal protein RodZ
MLPRTRTMLAAMFVTALIVTVVGTTIVPVPADSYVNRMALPRVDEPPPGHAQMASLKEQSRMPAYVQPHDQVNETRPVESSSNTSETMEGGTSTYAKTQAQSSEDHAARGSPAKPAPEQPPSNSDTKSADVAATGNANGASMATVETPAPHSDAAASSTLATARSDCEQRNGKIGFHGFRPAYYRLHAHHPRVRVWRRTWASRRVIARSASRPGTYSSF